jgi:predicted dehydrogenase
VPAHVTRFEPEHVKAREVVARGDIGQLRMASHAITSSFPDWNPHWYADEAQSGGPLLDLAIHSIDYLLWLFDSPPVRVYAVGVKAMHDLVTYASATIRLADGGIGLVETSWAHPSAQPLQLSAELVGTAGRLAWDYAGITSMTMIDQEAGRHDFVMLGEDSFAAQIAAFVGCIENDSAPPVSAGDGLLALRVSLAALESAVTGRAVYL